MRSLIGSDRYDDVKIKNQPEDFMNLLADMRIYFLSIIICYDIAYVLLLLCFLFFIIGVL